MSEKTNDVWFCNVDLGRYQPSDSFLQSHSVRGFTMDGAGRKDLSMSGADAINHLRRQKI